MPISFQLEVANCRFFLIIVRAGHITYARLNKVGVERTTGWCILRSLYQRSMEMTEAKPTLRLPIIVEETLKSSMLLNATKIPMLTIELNIKVDY